jgi:hypothetical protein
MELSKYGRLKMRGSRLVFYRLQLTPSRVKTGQVFHFVTWTLYVSEYESLPIIDYVWNLIRHILATNLNPQEETPSMELIGIRKVSGFLIQML